MTKSAMKLVYVIAPYRAPTAWQREQHIQTARHLGATIAQCGAMPVIPQANTAHMDGLMPEAFWLEGTRELLRRCDAAVLGPGWSRSEGSCAERAEARRRGIPVFASVCELQAWLTAAAEG